MKIRRCLRDACVVGAIFMALQIFQAFLLKEALKQQDHLLAYRLEASVAEVLNQAHKAKDDIAIYHIINALAQSRGVVQARIVDAESEKTLSRHGGVCLYALEEGGQKWGSLALSFSDRFSRTLVRRQWLKGMSAASVIWLMLFLYSQVLEKRISNGRAQITELNGLLQAEKHKLSSSQERAQLTFLQVSAGLQKAVGFISKPVIMLDAQQRISALSPAACVVLEIHEASIVLGKSWHEIPLLASCGAGLERSLVYPGQPVDCPTSKTPIQVRFETDANGLGGTWATFFGAKHVVE